MHRIGRLHLITDRLDVMAAALDGGVDTVQVRVADGWTDRQAYALAGAAVALCRRYGVPCLVNDRLHVAVAVGGATARDPATARCAVADGADYLGVGPAYPTSTKDGLPTPIGPAGVAAVAAAVDVPVIAIGGVTAVRVAELRAAGAYGVAVVGAIGAAADPAAAAAELRRALSGPAGGGADPAATVAGPRGGAGAGR